MNIGDFPGLNLQFTSAMEAARHAPPHLLALPAKPMRHSVVGFACVTQGQIKYWKKLLK